MLADHLKRLRERHDYTKKYVSTLLNISPSAYLFYETGKNAPPISAIVKLAELYNVSTDFILERKPADIKTSGEFDFLSDIIEDLRGLEKTQQQQVAEYVRLLKLDNAVNHQPAKRRERKPQSSVPTIAAFGGGVQKMDLQKQKELDAYKKSLEIDKKE